MVRLPHYIKETKEKDKLKDRGEDEKDKVGPNRRNKRSKSRNDDDRKESKDPDRSYRLDIIYEYCRVFGFKNCKGIVQPKMDSGESLCSGFHAKGFCLVSKCNRCHRKMTDSKKVKWKKFLSALIEKFKAQG